MTEQQIQKKILDYLKAKGAYTVKVIQANRAGIPDIIACYKGRFFGIEVKTTKGKPSALQLKNLDMINKAGGIGVLARSVEDIAKAIQEYEQLIQ